MSSSRLDTRGRKEDSNLAYSKSRENSRAFRHRRAELIRSLKSRVTELEKENALLRGYMTSCGCPPTDDLDDSQQHREQDHLRYQHEHHQHPYDQQHSLQYQYQHQQQQQQHHQQLILDSSGPYLHHPTSPQTPQSEPSGLTSSNVVMSRLSSSGPSMSIPNRPKSSNNNDNNNTIIMDDNNVNGHNFNSNNNNNATTTTNANANDLDPHRAYLLSQQEKDVQQTILSHVPFHPNYSRQQNANYLNNHHKQQQREQQPNYYPQTAANLPQTQEQQSLRHHLASPHTSSNINNANSAPQQEDPIPLGSIGIQRSPSTVIHTSAPTPTPTPAARISSSVDSTNAKPCKGCKSGHPPEVLCCDDWYNYI